MKKFLVLLSSVFILFGTMVGANASPPPTIVVIDTGIDMSNKFVSNRIVGEVCILVQNTCPNGKNFMDGTGSATLDPKLVLGSGFYHGTQMAGIIAENSNANIIAIRIIGMNENGTRAVSNVSVMERSLQWVVDNKNKYNISAVSISQTIRTTSSCMSNKSIESNVATLKSLGVLVAASSGNDSDYVRTSFPACLKDIVSIGATDPIGPKGQFPALYSNYSDDFYMNGTMNTFSNSIKKSRSVGTSNATALFSATWVSRNMTYEKFKSSATFVSTAKVKNVMVVK
jgi:hypothetical protein